MTLPAIESVTASLALPGLGPLLERLPGNMHRLALSTARHPWPVVAVGVALGLSVGGISYLRRKRRPSQQELERLRRERLASIGRIVAGTLLDDTEVETVNIPATTLFYRYRIAGVEYSCAQDLSSLPIPVERLRLDLPIQIRYDSRNPGDSIVAAEHWNGLCL